MLRAEEVGAPRRLDPTGLALAGASAAVVLLLSWLAGEAGAQIGPQGSIVSGNTLGNKTGSPAMQGGSTQAAGGSNPASAGAPLTPAEMRRFIEFVKMLIVNYNLHFHTAQEWENFLEIAYVFWLIEEDVTPLQPPLATTTTRTK
jgi:hypothetical protein